MCIKYTGKLGLVAHVCHPGLLQKPRQEDYKVKASMGNLVNCYLRIKK